MKTKVEPNKLITLRNPRSPISEQFRNIRTNLDFSNMNLAHQTIMITSADPATGKSTIAANLAVVCANNGKKTLLIDADLRKPSQSHYFPSANGSGLTDELIGRIPWTDSVITTDIDNLFVLSAGTIPPSPAELLASPAFKALLKTLSENFDQIIIDTPPVLAVTDAQIIATLVDGTLLVVRSKYTKVENAKKTMSKLQTNHANIIGCILNQVKSKEENYYY